MQRMTSHPLYTVNDAIRDAERRLDAPAPTPKPGMVRSYATLVCLFAVGLLTTGLCILLAALLMAPIAPYWTALMAWVLQ